MVPLKSPGERAMTLFHAYLMAPRWAAGPFIILGVPGKKGREEARFWSRSCATHPVPPVVPGRRRIG